MIGNSDPDLNIKIERLSNIYEEILNKILRGKNYPSCYIDIHLTVIKINL